MLHFFRRGTRFGRALIFSALLLLVGIIFSVMNPFSSLSDVLGWSDVAGSVMLVGQSPSANVPDPVSMPACKATDGPCMVTANAAAPGKMPANVQYIRKVKPGLFGGIPWSPFVNAFFALWVICAIVGSYILVQETLDLVTNHFRSPEESSPPRQGSL